MIEILFYIIAGIVFLEIFLRIIVAVFIDKTFNSIFSKNVPLWKVYKKFGKINEKDTINKLRFDSREFMGLSKDEFIKISAKACNTSEENIKKSYSGYHAFDKLKYQPFVGLFNSPNQKLSYAEIDKMGAQGNIKKIEKPLNVKRLMILGNSVAFGLGSTCIKNNITSKLIKYLNQDLNYNNKIQWEVINLAFVSSQTTSDLNLINKYSELYNPDYVFHLGGFTDLYFYLQPNSKLYSFNFSSELTEFLYSSNIVKIIDDCSEYSMILKVVRKIFKSKKKDNNQNNTFY